MTRDEIIRLVREIAGSDFENATVDEKMLDELMPLCMAVASAERERCAKVCDAEVVRLGQMDEAFVAAICASAIRRMK